MYLSVLCFCVYAMKLQTVCCTALEMHFMGMTTPSTLTHHGRPIIRCHIPGIAKRL